jgi:hypothetical protein
MISIKSGLGIMALLLFTGCGSKEEETTPDIPANTMSPAPTVKPMPAPSNLSTSTAMLNPAHGQPGHRCDIAVGAPLDSKPVQPVPQATTPEKAPVLNTNPANGVSAAGLNPSHGQPGHRCDIPVGAPLNSKPSK